MTRLIPTLTLIVGTTLGCLAFPAGNRASAAAPPARVVVQKAVKHRYHRRHPRRARVVVPGRRNVHRPHYYWRRHHRVRRF